MEPNKVLSKELQVEPLKPGEKATYRLLNTGKKSNVFDENGNMIPVKTPVYSPEGIEMVYDSIKKEMVTIMCVERYEPFFDEKNQVQVQKPIKSRPIFKNGELTVNHTQNMMYQFLERSNKNASNPFRNKEAGAARFERVDEVKDTTNELRNFEMHDDAILHLAGANVDEIRAIALQLPQSIKRKVNPDATPEAMKLSLRKLIDEGFAEQILKVSNNQNAILKIQILDAERFQIIRRDEAGRAWKYNKGREMEDKKQLICSVSPQQNMIDGLISFLTNDKKPENTKHYDHIHGILKGILGKDD